MKVRLNRELIWPIPLVILGALLGWYLPLALTGCDRPSAPASPCRAHTPDGGLIITAPGEGGG